MKYRAPRCRLARAIENYREIFLQGIVRRYIGLPHLRHPKNRLKQIVDLMRYAASHAANQFELLAFAFHPPDPLALALMLTLPFVLPLQLFRLLPVG